MELWIVGKIKSRKHYKQWEFQGVFNDEQKAVNACRTWKYFVAPAILNRESPDETREWEGLYYPIAETQDEEG